MGIATKKSLQSQADHWKKSPGHTHQPCHGFSVKCTKLVPWMVLGLPKKKKHLEKSMVWKKNASTAFAIVCIVPRGSPWVPGVVPGVSTSERSGPSACDSNAWRNQSLVPGPEFHPLPCNPHGDGFCWGGEKNPQKRDGVGKGNFFGAQHWFIQNTLIIQIFIQWVYISPF